MPEQVQAGVTTLQVHLAEDHVRTAGIESQICRIDIGHRFDREVRLAAEDGSNPFANHGMLVNDQEPDHLRGTATTRCQRMTVSSDPTSVTISRSIRGAMSQISAFMTATTHPSAN